MAVPIPGRKFFWRAATGRNEGFAADASEGSAALSPIRAGSEILGVLAVGARDSQRYRQEDGTLFLDYLAEVIGQLPASKSSYPLTEHIDPA